MATSAEGRTPVHLWIVGILALLWAAIGCLDYWMTETANKNWMSSVPPDTIAYVASLPKWLIGMWALGVWGGLAGSILLLMRNRYAVWAYGLSLIGAIVGLGYQMFMMQRPASMTAGASAFVPWVIIVICAFLFWYARTMEKKGVLR